MDFPAPDGQSPRGGGNFSTVIHRNLAQSTVMPCFPPPPRQIPFGILAFQNFRFSAFSATPMSKSPRTWPAPSAQNSHRPLLAFSIYPSAFLPPPPAFARPGHCQWQPTNSHKTFVCQKKLRNNGAGTARPRLFPSRSDCPTVAVRLQPTERGAPKHSAARRLNPPACSAPCPHLPIVTIGMPVLTPDNWQTGGADFPVNARTRLCATNPKLRLGHPEFKHPETGFLLRIFRGWPPEVANRLHLRLCRKSGQPLVWFVFGCGRSKCHPFVKGSVLEK